MFAGRPEGLRYAIGPEGLRYAIGSNRAELTCP